MASLKICRRLGLCRVVVWYAPFRATNQSGPYPRCGGALELYTGGTETQVDERQRRKVKPAVYAMWSAG